MESVAISYPMETWKTAITLTDVCVYVWLCMQQLNGNHIVARLMEIRDYSQQATAMLEALGTQHDPVSTVSLY